MAEKVYGNRWKTIETLGEGGQGQVFLVEDLENENKSYVLKRLKNNERINRFKSEIEAIKKLKHPNIVNLIDFDLENNKPYLVTDYCAGGELTFDKVSSFSTIEKLKLFSTICKAIGYAHENGIIHRDIKPANILLQSDEKTPVVTDFGICFNTDEGLERLTETIEQVGARFYMAPELRDGRAEDNKIIPESDVYSLGKLLYWMFRGRVMDRENFNEKEWDLRNYKTFDHSMHFIYEIFEKTIILNSKISFLNIGYGRFTNAKELANDIDKIIYILEQKGRYLDINIPQKCIFCEIGKYEIFAIPINPNTGAVMNFSGSFPNLYSNNTYGDPQSFCYVCNNCGNIQFFNRASIKGNWKMKNKDRLSNFY